jgi:hypothetical protein
MEKRGEHNETVINLTRSNFDVALSVTYIGSQDGVAENLDTYFSFYIQKVFTELITDKKKQKEIGSTYTWVTKPFKLEKCEGDRFNNLTEEMINLGIRKNYFCPESDFNVLL